MVLAVFGAGGSAMLASGPSPRITPCALPVSPSIPPWGAAAPGCSTSRASPVPPYLGFPQDQSKGGGGSAWGGGEGRTDVAGRAQADGAGGAGAGGQPGAGRLPAQPACRRGPRRHGTGPEVPWPPAPRRRGGLVGWHRWGALRRPGAAGGAGGCCQGDGLGVPWLRPRSHVPSPSQPRTSFAGMGAPCGMGRRCCALIPGLCSPSPPPPECTEPPGSSSRPEPGPVPSWHPWVSICRCR